MKQSVNQEGKGRNGRVFPRKRIVAVWHVVSPFIAGTVLSYWCFWKLINAGANEYTYFMLTFSSQRVPWKTSVSWSFRRYYLQGGLYIVKKGYTASQFLPRSRANKASLNFRWRSIHTESQCYFKLNSPASRMGFRFPSFFPLCVNFTSRSWVFPFPLLYHFIRSNVAV